MCEHCPTPEPRDDHPAAIPDIIPPELAEPLATETDDEEEAEEASSVECADCGTAIEPDDATTLDDGHTYCPDCVQTCERCGEPVRYGELVDIRAGTYSRTTHSWCEGCADGHSYCCADCGDRFTDDGTSYTNDNDDPICERCRENYYSCDRCGCTIHCDNTHSFDEDCNTYCEECYDRERAEREEEDDDRLADYHDGLADYHDGDRKDLFRGLDMTNPALMGVELETYLPDRMGTVADCQRAVDEPFFAERDGSLSDNHGCEFVFRPYTLAQLNEQDNAVRQVARVCRENRGIAWDAGTGYGMHINVNARAMTPLHAAKFTRFINEQRDLCEHIAGRKECNWARYHTATKLSRENIFRDKYLAASRRDKNRIEVRIFRASLSELRILRNCEFVDAVREFTKTAACRDLTANTFKAWLAFPAQSNYRRLRQFYGIVQTRQTESSVDDR